MIRPRYRDSNGRTWFFAQPLTEELRIELGLVADGNWPEQLSDPIPLPEPSPSSLERAARWTRDHLRSIQLVRDPVWSQAAPEQDLIFHVSNPTGAAVNVQFEFGPEEPLELTTAEPPPILTVEEIERTRARLIDAMSMSALEFQRLYMTDPLEQHHRNEREALENEAERNLRALSSAQMDLAERNAWQILASAFAEPQWRIHLDAAPGANAPQQATPGIPFTGESPFTTPPQPQSDPTACARCIRDEVDPPRCPVLSNYGESLCRDCYTVTMDELHKEQVRSMYVPPKSPPGFTPIAPRKK